VPRKVLGLDGPVAEHRRACDDCGRCREPLRHLADQVELLKALSGCRMHSSDFRSILWDSTAYFFSGTQARVVAALWKAAAAGVPALWQETLHAVADGSLNTRGFRVRDLFRGHQAWGTLIVPGPGKGLWQLGGSVA
jgi:hypothetical protein